MSHERIELQEWLSERGYSANQIAKILGKLDEFDSKTNRESIFDAMETGELDMDALIKQASGMSIDCFRTLAPWEMG
ncbi:MAG: hypothetical protein HY288_01730 [Planctomycetia bacterium]|nr:hypothetical protein [Planctomycetia bacterium]